MAASSSKSDHRRWIYAGFDAIFALVYLLVLWSWAPGRHLSGAVVAWALVVGPVLAASGMTIGARRGWLLAVTGCSLVLLVELVLLILLLWSASFLFGVYGAFGQGAGALTLLVAALSFELVALLPALQLKYLLSRGGRRAMGALDAPVRASLP